MTLSAEKFELRANGEVIMKLGFGLTLFLPKPFNNIKGQIEDFWERYVSLVGEKTFTWARLGGGNRSRPVSPSVLRTIRSWLSGEKSYGGDCWISIHDGPFDAIGSNSFRLEGLDQPGEDVGFLEVMFPAEIVSSPSCGALLKTVLNLVDGVPFLTGTAGYAFHRSPYKLDETIGRMRSLSARFEGVEVSANERMCYWAGKGMASMNWITFLDSTSLEKLGGSQDLRNRLPKDAALLELKSGAALVAGDCPKLGDKNMGVDELTLWRQVYALVRSVQFVDPVYEFDPDYFNGQETTEWLTRLSR